MLLSDAKYTYVKGTLTPLDALPEDEVESQYLAMTNRALEKIKQRGLDTSKARILRSLDLRYIGQGYELQVASTTPFQRHEAARAFEEIHEATYGYRHIGENVEVTALRLTVVIPLRKVKLGSAARHAPRPHDFLKSRRKCLFNGDWYETPVYARELLSEDFAENGPAIIEEYDSTIVVPPNWNCQRDSSDCIVMRRIA
jgi:N-methylhydantoinase A